MNKEFIPYEQAFEIMDLGFDQLCFGSYVRKRSDLSLYFQLGIAIDLTPLDSSSCHAPLYQQAFRWFRENYPYLDFGIGKIHNGTNNYHYHINLEWEFFEGTYEEAELACLKKLIEMVKLSK